MHLFELYKILFKYYIIQILCLNTAIKFRHKNIYFILRPFVVYCWWEAIQQPSLLLVLGLPNPVVFMKSLVYLGLQWSFKNFSILSKCGLHSKTFRHWNLLQTNRIFLYRIVFTFIWIIFKKKLLISLVHTYSINKSEKHTLLHA